MDTKEMKEKLKEIAEMVKEFPEAVQPNVFEKLYNNAFPSGVKTTGKTTSSRKIKKTTNKEKKVENSLEKGKKKSKAKSENYSLDKNLDLRGDSKIPSFRDFIAGKNPKSSAEFTATSVYYLIELLGFDNVNLNQLYTCYKEVSRRTPTAFKQTVINAKSREGFIDIDADGNIEIPIRGKNLVEHDLPRKEKLK